MRHVGFVLLLLLALCMALPPSIVFSMNECQLNTSSAAIDECFRNAERSRLIYAGTLVAGLVLSTALHVVGSRWKVLGLMALAVGPWLTLLV